MQSIKGHFNGAMVVLDEPASLVAGQSVRIVVDKDLLHPSLEKTSTVALSDHIDRKSLVGFAKGLFDMCDDFNDPLDEFAEYR